LRTASSAVPLQSYGPPSTNHTSTQAFKKVGTYGAIIEKAATSSNRNRVNNPSSALLLTNQIPIKLKKKKATLQQRKSVL
jgi:hypothetical protein